MDQPVFKGRTRSQSETSTVSRSVQGGHHQCFGLLGDKVIIWKVHANFKRDESQKSTQSRGDVTRSAWKTTIRTTRIARGLGVESYTASTHIQTDSSLGCAQSQKIDKSRLAFEDGIRRFQGVVRQTERGGEIIASSNGEDAQKHLRPERCIRQ